MSNRRPHSPRLSTNELIRLAARRPRNLSCGTFTLSWQQNYEKDKHSTMKIRVQKVEIGSELLGHFVKFQMIFEDIVQEIESHVEDLKSEEFLGILKEFYVSQQNTQPMIHFQFTNLRKSLSYHGKCELLSSEEGEFHQLINLFIKKVPLLNFSCQNYFFHIYDILQENDQLLLSLCYDTTEEKLTLGINSVKLGSQTRLKISDEVGLYVKVTLFESMKVVKAKKTGSIKIIHNQVDGEFKETFSILFPQLFMDKVSCTISLCWKTKTHGKLVLGRTNIGPNRNDEGQDHWFDMKSNLNKEVTRWHILKA